MAQETNAGLRLAGQRRAITALGTKLQTAEQKISELEGDSKAKAQQLTSAKVRLKAATAKARACDSLEEQVRTLTAKLGASEEAARRAKKLHKQSASKLAKALRVLKVRDTDARNLEKALKAERVKCSEQQTELKGARAELDHLRRQNFAMLDTIMRRQASAGGVDAAPTTSFVPATTAAPPSPPRVPVSVSPPASPSLAFSSAPSSAPMSPSSLVLPGNHAHPREYYRLAKEAARNRAPNKAP